MAPKSTKADEFIREQGGYVAPWEYERYAKRTGISDPYEAQGMPEANVMLTNIPGSAEAFVGRGGGRNAILLVPPAEYAARQGIPGITTVEDRYAAAPMAAKFEELPTDQVQSMKPYDRMLYEQQKLYGGIPKEEAIFARAKVLTDQMLNKMDAYTASRLDYGTLYRQNIQNVAKSFEEQEKTLTEGMKAQAKEETELEKWMNRQRILAELEKKKEQKADLTESDKQQKERLAGYAKAMALFNKHAGDQGQIENEDIKNQINDILEGSGNQPLQEQKYGRYFPGTNMKMWQADSTWKMPKMPGRATAGQARAAESSSPPVNLLSEGTSTTFKNGQVWTLKNGTPTRVK